MKNLENLSVQRLNPNEVININGGFGGVGSLGAKAEGWLNAGIAVHSFLHGMAEGFIIGAERVLKAYK